MANLVAVKDKIIVKIIKKDKTSGGIIIPEDAINEPQGYGLVVSVGEEVPDKVKIDGIILFAPFGGQDIVYDKNIYKVLAYGEVFCVLEGSDIKDFKEMTIGGKGK